MSMKTLEEFVKDKYENGRMLHKYYKSFEAYQERYIGMNGFSEWLEDFRGQSISLDMMHHIAHVYITYGKRLPVEVPLILSSIERYYGCDLPVKEGILTEGYWRDFSNNLNSCLNRAFYLMKI